MARTKTRAYHPGDEQQHRSDDDDSDEAGGQQGNDSNDEGGRRGRGFDGDASSGHDPSGEDDQSDLDDPSEDDDANDSDRGQHDVVTAQKQISTVGCEPPGARESAQAFLEDQLQGATLQKFPYVAGQLVNLLAEPIDVSARDWPTTPSAIRKLAERHRNRGAVRIDAPQELIEIAMTADFWCRMLGFLYGQGSARNAAAGPLIVHEPDKMLDCRPDDHPAYFFKESHGDEEFCVEIQVLEFQWQNHAAMTTGTYAMLSPRIYQRLPVTHVTRLDGRRAFRVALVPAKDESESEGSDGEFDEYSDSWTVGYETCNKRRGWALEQVRGWYAKDAEHPHTMWCNTTQGDRRFRRLSGPRRPGYSITSDPFIAAILVPSDPLQTGLTLYRSVLRSVRPIRETVRRGDFHIEIDSRSVSELASQALSLIAADNEGKPADIWSAPQAVRDLCMAVFCTVEDCFWAANFDIDYSKCILERWTSTTPQMKDGTVGGSYFFPFRCTNGIMTETSVSMSGDRLLVNVKFDASTVAFGPDRETECPAECILYVQMLGSEGCSSVRAALKSVLTCEVEDVVLEAHPPNEWLVQQALYGRNADPYHPDRLGSVLTSLLAAAYPDGSADLNVEWKADIPDRNILAGTRRTISFLIREKASQSAVEVVFERDLTRQRKVSARQVVNSNTVKLRVTVRRFNAWSVWPKSMKDHLALKLLAGYLDKHGLSSNSAEDLLDTFSNGGSVQLSAWKVWQRSFCFWKLEWLDKHILDLLQYLSLIAGAGMPTKCAFTAEPIQSLRVPALGFPCRVAWLGTVEWPESKATVECVMQRESYNEPISGADRYAFTLQVNVRVSSMHPDSIGPKQAAEVMVSTPQAGIAGSQAKAGGPSSASSSQCPGTDKTLCYSYDAGARAQHGAQQAPGDDVIAINASAKKMLVYDDKPSGGAAPEIPSPPCKPSALGITDARDGSEESNMQNNIANEPQRINSDSSLQLSGVLDRDGTSQGRDPEEARLEEARLSDNIATVSAQPLGESHGDGSSVFSGSCATDSTTDMNVVCGLKRSNPSVMSIKGSVITGDIESAVLELFEAIDEVQTRAAALRGALASSLSKRPKH